jgi:hypothetical protein
MAGFFQGASRSEIKVSTVMSKQLFVCISDDELSAAEKIVTQKLETIVERQRSEVKCELLTRVGDLLGEFSESEIWRPWHLAPRAVPGTLR